jgi:hypothetical protein
LFNSCNGLNIADAIIELGLSQAVVMREPIHDQVARDFLTEFLQKIYGGEDVHDALLSTCEYLKTKQNLTYPSAYLIPSIFRHPDAQLFRLRPWGWLSKIKQWLPNKLEAVTLSILFLCSLEQLPMQPWLLATRQLAQAAYRDYTGQLYAPKSLQNPPVLLVEIDSSSLRSAPENISEFTPLNRRYLARLVDKLIELDISIIGIDYILDLPQPENDADLARSLKSAVSQTPPTWFVFTTIRGSGDTWNSVHPKLASSHWSLNGHIYVLARSSYEQGWYMRLLMGNEPEQTPYPFSYLLAWLAKIEEENAQDAFPKPSLENQSDLIQQMGQDVPKEHKDLQRERFFQPWQKQPITSLSYKFLKQKWFYPTIDFSIPPDRVYQKITAKELLAMSGDRQASLPPVAIIAAGDYGNVGLPTGSQDGHPIPDAFQYWIDENRLEIYGGEIHAFMMEHVQNQRQLYWIPDIFAIALAVIIGTILKQIFANDRQRLSRRKIVAIGSAIAVLYVAISLQVYIWWQLAIPIVLPAIALSSYILSIFWRRNQ